MAELRVLVAGVLVAGLVVLMQRNNITMGMKE
jgi:hypothetical protein